MRRAGSSRIVEHPPHLTTRTGQLAFPTTPAATLPSIILVRLEVFFLVPKITRSASILSAKLHIVVAMAPLVSNVSDLYLTLQEFASTSISARVLLLLPKRSSRRIERTCSSMYSGIWTTQIAIISEPQGNASSMA